MNNPTLALCCGRMIGRADIEESKSNVAMNAWLPQASYPCVCIRTENQNQRSFYPFVLHEISVLIELLLGHLCYRLTDVPPQPNSPSDNVSRVDRARGTSYNSDWALRYLSRALQQHTWPARPHTNRATLLFFGANDAVLEGKGGQHVPLKCYVDNLRAMARLLQPFGPVVLITPPPVDAKAWALTAQKKYQLSSVEQAKTRTLDNTARYARAVVQLAEELGLSCVDAFAMEKERDWESMLSDGLHLAPNGAAWLFTQVSRVLGDAGLGPEKLLLDAPLHTDIDHNNPQASFALQV
eukprot:g51745.t1